MDEFETYITEPVASARRGRKRRGLALYLGFAVLLSAASLVAVNSRSGAASKFPRVLVPGSSGTCSSPPDGDLFSQSADGAQMTVCISRQGNINQINYPDIAVGHTQIAWDGYCMADADTFTEYKDFSPGSPVAPSGWAAATFTQTASNQFSMVRNSADGKYQLIEFIKINFQPRSIFVGMTVKNVDPANVTHRVGAVRELAPAIDGNAADDQYNEFGGTGGGLGRTDEAFQGPLVGTNALLVGATQSDAAALTAPVASFQSAGGCGNYTVDTPGYVSGGNRVLLLGRYPNSGGLLVQSVAHNASVNVGKFVYRMI